MDDQNPWIGKKYSQWNHLLWKINEKWKESYQKIEHNEKLTKTTGTNSETSQVVENLQFDKKKFIYD